LVLHTFKKLLIEAGRQMRPFMYCFMGLCVPLIVGRHSLQCTRAATVIHPWINKLVIKEFVFEFGDTCKTSTQITPYDMDNLLCTVLNIF
jgi:hypothetical protein